MARALKDQSSMRAWPAAGVFAIPPIEEVVAALLARRRVVGNLVGRQPGNGGQLLRDLEKGKRLLAFGHDELARGLQSGKRRLGLDRELVEREMAACEREGFAELAAPVLHCLVGTRVDEVKRDAVEMRVRNGECGDGLGRGVDAPKRLQDIVAQRLHAERDAIDAGLRVAREAAGLNAAGVGFERDLRARSDAPELCDAIEDRGNRLRLHERGSAAAEKDAGNRTRAGERRRMLELAQVGREKPLFIDAAEAHVTIEVAVGALLRAERPVHVDAEAGLVRRPHHRGRHA